MQLSIIRSAICVVLFTTGAGKAVAQSSPAYQPLPTLEGKLVSAGSDTLANLMSFWTAEFADYYPAVEFELHSEGSATAPPALLNGSANIAPMSRQMNQAEIEAFRQKFGYVPTAVRVAVDAIAIFVHQHNPLSSITLEQLGGIFAQASHCQSDSSYSHWGQLGLQGSLAEAEISIIGRNADSGSYGFFREQVLCNQDFSANMQKLPGSASIVQAISYRPNAIGFSGMGYKTSGVKTLAIRQHGQLTLPQQQGTSNWNYPLSRYLYLYVNQAPDTQLPALLREFLLLVLSANGQNIVEQDGYSAVSRAVISADLHRLGLAAEK